MQQSHPTRQGANGKYFYSRDSRNDDEQLMARGECSHAGRHHQAGGLHPLPGEEIFVLTLLSLSIATIKTNKLIFNDITVNLEVRSSSVITQFEGMH